MPDTEDIHEALAKTEEELLIELGKDLDKKSFNALPSLDVFLENGKKYLAIKRNSIREVVCTPTIKALFESSDQVFIVSGLLDVISSVVTGVSPVTVAALIVKYGHTKFCESK